MILLSITILVLTGSRPLKAIDFVFCTDIVKPYSAVIWLSLCASYSHTPFLVSAEVRDGEVIGTSGRVGTLWIS